MCCNSVRASPAHTLAGAKNACSTFHLPPEVTQNSRGSYQKIRGSYAEVMQELCRSYQKLRGSYAEVCETETEHYEKMGREGGTPDVMQEWPP
jgi:hypothetical protein